MSDKTILCAIDFSESSLQALKWSLKMAQLMHTSAIILFCYRLIANGEEETLDLKRKMEKEALRKFAEIEKKLIHDRSISYQFVSEVGFFPSRIEMFIRKSPVGLLVMGNSIVQNFNEYKTLSFEQFLKDSKVPVVIVSEEALDLVQVN